MEATLFKAQFAYPDCSTMASKLRAMNSNTEEQLRAQQRQASYLTQVASRTMPKGLHCLSLSLVSQYFGLDTEKQMLPRGDSVEDPELYHYAVFSDNVLACAVVVNSTICNSKVFYYYLFSLFMTDWYQSDLFSILFCWNFNFCIGVQSYWSVGQLIRSPHSLI
jgi:hypothetical protein